MTTNAQKYTAELLGTLVIVFVGSIAIITTNANVLVSALAFGLAWAGMWWVFGHVSGGHFNPAITIANLVAKRTNSKDLVPYIVCQIIGGILGSALVWFIFRGAPAAMTATGTLASTLAAPTMGTGVDAWAMTSVLLLELLLTAFLTMIWLTVTEKTNAPGITGLTIGLGYAGILTANLAVTWSALNPVRTLGPAFLASTGMSTLWVFWVAPIVGAVVGAGLWMAVVMPARTTAPSTYTAEA
jgi:aquaporin Z